MSSPVLKLVAVAALLAAMVAGCSRSDTRSPAVADEIRKSLDQSGYKDVSVSQDREKGVVSLTGHVASDADKQQAESIAKSMAAGQVVADEIQVLPAGAESDAKAVTSDLDKGDRQEFRCRADSEQTEQRHQLRREERSGDAEGKREFRNPA